MVYFLGLSTDLSVDVTVFRNVISKSFLLVLERLFPFFRWYSGRKTSMFHGRETSLSFIWFSKGRGCRCSLLRLEINFLPSTTSSLSSLNLLYYTVRVDVSSFYCSIHELD